MKYVAKGLQVLGALALILIAIIAGYVAYDFVSNSDKINAASKSDVLFVLSRSGLKPDQEYSVLNSFTSERTFTGDHLDYYCVQITDFSPSDHYKEDWLPLDSIESTVREASMRAMSEGNASQCFGQHPDKNILTYVGSITLYTRGVAAYDVIFFDKATQRLLYVSSKT